MELCFFVHTHEDGWLLRDFLRKHAVSAGLMAAVKTDKGFFAVQCGCAAGQTMQVYLCNAEKCGKSRVPMRANQRVQAGQCICFSLPAEKDTTVTPQRIVLHSVYEDAHCMVLNKPAGQAVHPTRGYTDGTLANAFCGEMQRRGHPAVFRPINRIDRNTSGLVLCAKNAYAAPLLADSVQKVYYAVVEGEMPFIESEICAPIALAEHSLIQRMVSETGKPSCTQYKVLAAGGGLSLVQCRLLTGRTHQIRVHFSHVGHPLAGDDLYGGSTVHLARQALHCGKMVFTNPQTNLPVQVHAPMPEDMQTLVAQNMRFFASCTK